VIAKGVKVQSLADRPLTSTRSILFLFSDTGGGHRASAKAIDSGLHDLDGSDNLRVHHVDAFAACGTFPLREGVASYGSMLKVQPSPYPAIFHLTNGRTRFRVIAELGKPFIRRNFRRMLLELRPDLVVSVHPLLNVYARQLIDASGLRAPLVTVITDLVTIHHSWTAAGAADEYVVGSPEARGVCADRGIPLSRIHDLGLPIRAGFEPGGAQRGPAKRALDLDPSRQTLLVMAGGEGGGRVPKLLQDVAPVIRALDLQVVAIAGKNAALRRKLSALGEMLGRDARVLGFVENIAEYMRAADVLLTKAGPGTIAEAAASGLPVILCDYISGQEAGNLDYVKSRRTGVVALESDAVAAALRRLFGAAGMAELDRMRERALMSARPDAARFIARFLLDLLESAAPVSA
jgi:1,2-diacylglycerol 3-beta-galactosyltransferase